MKLILMRLNSLNRSIQVLIRLSSRITGIGLVCILSLLFIFYAIACNGNASITSQPQAGPNNDTGPISFFPVQLPKYANGTAPLGIAEGVLILDNGYLRLKPDINPNESKLLIWPTGFSPHIENDVIRIVNKNGIILAKVGDPLKAVGGEVFADIVVKYTGRNLPEDCKGPYFLVVAIETTLPAPSTMSNNDSAGFSNTDDALLRDAENYARTNGVTIDEALRRLKMQDTIGMLNAQLTEQESETFAGLWIQHTPDFRVAVLFTRDGENTIKPYIQDELAGLVEIRTAKFSLADLRKAQSEALSTFREVGIPIDSGISISENLVTISIAEANRIKVEESIKSGELVVSDKIKMHFVFALATPG